MESPASAIVDDGFLNEALAILDSLADDHFSLKLEEDSDVTAVAVGDFLDAAIETLNGDGYPEDTLKLATAHGKPTSQPGNQCKGNILLNADAASATQPQGRRRIRMREQLIQLRSVVKKMETHLETLKRPDSSRSEGDMQSEKETLTWRNIALEQFQARREAEFQNAQLRDNLLASIQLSERVKNLLNLQHSVSTATSSPC
ncbi:hypothetical protein P3T76_007045 [Phytophthora citrophthora]|uniref:Uncharacterized protein n=1 Tax=Phytophthora citrophthora TaxID=4793 RepID=A0AAD9GMK8_9STRA|nr:hypothetical protein P3T76_007045 [Phytophthora citrophthora]